MELKNVILEKNNGVVRVFDTFDAEAKSIETKCAGCSNGYPGLCSRMDIDNLRTIDKYDFIESGMQKIDAKGNIDRFVVTECANHDERIKKTNLNLNEKSELVNSLMVDYFGAEDIDDAIRTQQRLAKEGKLKTNTTIAEQKKLVKKMSK